MPGNGRIVGFNMVNMSEGRGDFQGLPENARNFHIMLVPLSDISDSLSKCSLKSCSSDICSPWILHIAMVEGYLSNLDIVSFIQRNPKGMKSMFSLFQNCICCISFWVAILSCHLHQVSPQCGASPSHKLVQLVSPIGDRCIQHKLHKPQKLPTNFTNIWDRHMAFIPTTLVFLSYESWWFIPVGYPQQLSEARNFQEDACG